MKHARNLFLMAAAFTTPLLSGASDWTKLQDFNTDASGFDITRAVNGSGELFLVTDPADANNQCFYVESGNYGVTDHNTTYATISLPNPIEDGQTGTVYFRFYQVDSGNNFHVALSDIAKEKDGADWIEPNAWSDMEPVFRYNHGELTLRDSGRYPQAGTGADSNGFVGYTAVNGVWYEFWMVVNNRSGVFEDDYSIYVKGGDYSEQTLLKINELDQVTGELTGSLWESAYFRNGTTDPLVSLIIASESGAAADPFNGDHMYVDDIFTAPGVALDAPVVNTTPVGWAGYPIDEATGNVDASDWLGPLNINVDPFIWSYGLESWLYVNKNRVSSSGGWMYIYK